jgi:hypothetical protein
MHLASPNQPSPRGGLLRHDEKEFFSILLGRDPENRNFKPPRGRQRGEGSPAELDVICPRQARRY